MEQVNVHQAKTNFSKLLARANAGKEIIITKSGKPYAKLVPIKKMEQRVPGIAKGAVTDAFFEPLSADELRGWE